MLIDDKEEFVELAKGLVFEMEADKGAHDEERGKNTRKTLYYVATDEEFCHKPSVVFPTDLTDEKLKQLFFDSQMKMVLGVVSQFTAEDLVTKHVLEALRKVPQLCIYPSHADHQSKTVTVFAWDGEQWKEATNKHLGDIFNPSNLIKELIEMLATD